MIRAIRGMNDILPDETRLWRRLERRCAEVLGSYGYREIRLPLVERTDLFSRAIGEVTDIVEKEMYSFRDRNGESLTLRPEGTAGCVRAFSQHGLLNTQRKLWYAGPMFRYERPQKGRRRQFHQIGVEAFGTAAAEVEAELIMAGTRLWRVLGIDAGVSLQLNSLGDGETRARYREALVTCLRDHFDDLDEDSRRRLDDNPLRILDSKSESTRGVLANAPGLPDYLDAESKDHFARLRELLDAAAIDYELNPRLVRGLDYYNRTVFEWVGDSLGAQGTVCAGGRYDGLVEQLGGRSTPAAGFAMGLERLVMMLRTREAERPGDSGAEVYFVSVGAAARAQALALAEALRDACPSRTAVVHVGGGGFGSQMKKADRSGASIAVILGDDELSEGRAGVKFLRREGDGASQLSVPFAELNRRIEIEMSRRSG